MIAMRPADLDDDVGVFLDVVEQFAQSQIAPRAAASDEAGEIDGDLVARLADAEMLVAGLPSEPRAGRRFDLQIGALVVERLAAASAAVASLAALTHTAGIALAAGGELGGWVDRLRDGVLLAPAYPATGGSIDLAERDGALSVDGVAPRVEQLERAEALLVLAGADDGPQAVVVDAAAAGVTRGPAQDRTGLRGVSTAALQLRGAPVARAFGPHSGAVARALLNAHWTTTAAMACGVARDATTRASAYLGERAQFGQTLDRFGGLRAMVAMLTTRTQGATALMLQAASRADATAAAAAADCAAAAQLATDTAVAVTIDAVQLLGGYGWIEEYPTARLMRDAASVRARAGGRRAPLKAVAAAALGTVNEERTR